MRLQVNAAEPKRIPTRLAVAALGGLVVEAVALVGVAGWVLVTVVAAGSTSLGVALFLAAFALGVGALLVVGARALLRGAPRARGPVVTWQLLQAATAVAVLGVPGRTGAAAGVAVGGIVLAVVVVAGVLSSPSAAGAR